MSKVELISSVNVEVEDAFSIPFIGFIATTVEKNIDLRHGFLKIYQAMKATSFPRAWKLANFRPGSRCCLFVFLLFVAVPME